MQKLNDLISKACLASELGKKGITIDLQTLSQVRDEFFAIQQRAEAAEAKLKLKSEKLLDCEQALSNSEAKLAELEKQEPGYEMFTVNGWMEINKEQYLLSDRTQGNFREVFTRPAPAINLAELVPDNIPKDVYEVIYQECGGFVDCSANAQTIWNACRAAILRNIEEAR